MNFTDNTDSNFKKKLDIAKENDRLGIHSFHRYYGKLIPAIPRAAINEFTSSGDLVFDPFVGSGTTAVESIYANRKFVGVEINPLSVLKIAQLKNEIVIREGKRDRMHSFLTRLKESADVLTQWNDNIWMLMVESGTINADKSITFKFYNGTTIEIK